MNQATLPPSGTVTFLFTDIEGSTRLLQHLGERYAEVLAKHHRLLRAAFQRWHGYELGTEGDSFVVAFPTAPDALAAVVEAQRGLAAYSWPEGAPVRVRMGLHTGEPMITPEGYVGLDIHLAARVNGCGHGGQILLSQRTRDLVVEALPSGVSLQDMGTHRLKDLLQPEHLFQVVIDGLPAAFPALKSLDNHPNNLPLQLASFIGREKELSELTQRLATARLLTLTGTGGCGKTRLALQVATDRLEAYGDGVWLVELAALAALADPALVPQAVASTFHLREEPGRTFTDTLVDYLRPRHVLLLLDNCEHLIDGCSRLAKTLLQVCPRVTVLATSREPLGIVGEVTWRVPSLPVPESSFPSSAGTSPSGTTTERISVPRGADGSSSASSIGNWQRITAVPSVALFIDRALLHQPTFAVREENLPALASVCRRLDGIPLAIELAAARVKALTVEQIDARLDNRFRLLATGSRTVLPRQQTLRATIDWSHDLLSEAERALLRRVAVFAGGCALEAAEAVCAGDGIEPFEVMDLMTQLVDKSLVGMEEQNGEARYRLLETIREYGAEKLHDAGEGAALRRSHRDWFLQLAEQADAGLRGPREGEWLDRLELEHDNLRSALGWTTENQHVEPGLRLAGALYRFWEVRGYWAEGREALARILALAGDAPPAARARALGGAGMLAWYQGDYGEAGARLEESLAIHRELQNQPGIANMLGMLGVVAEYRGDYAAARALHEESLATWRELGDQPGIATSLTNLGSAAIYQSDYTAARAFLEESLVIWRKLEEKYAIAATLTNLGVVAEYQGDTEAARALHEESLSLRRSLRDKLGIATSLTNLGVMARYQSDVPAARAFLEESLFLYQELGDQAGIGTSLGNLGNLALDEQEFDRACSFHQRSLAIRRGLDDKRGIWECLEGLAGVASEWGYREQAVRLFGAAQALRDALSAPLSPHERAQLERHIAAARAGLGEEAFAAAWAEGQTMLLELAIEQASAIAAP